MCVLFVDVYAASAGTNFKGNYHCIIAACSMTSFTVAELSLQQTAQSMASSLMKVWPQFGFSHTIVVTKANSFLRVFAETTALLGINIHVLSSENYDPTIVERIDHFLNSCLTIFCNKPGTTQVAQEGILMSL